jgi:hypothetical protein
MKRIALLAAGIPNFKFTINNFFQRVIFTDHDCEFDIFFCFWKNRSNHDQMNFINDKDVFNEEVFSEILPKNFKLKKVVFIDEPNFSKDLLINDTFLKKVVDNIKQIEYNFDWAVKFYNSTLKQFLALKYVFDLCELSNINYDYYMRFRLDGITNYKIDFNNYREWMDRSVFVPSNNKYCLGNPEIPINDQLAISDHEGMKIYCSLFDEIMNYVNKENVFFHQETLLSYHLFKNNLKVQELFLDYHLIRD